MTLRSHTEPIYAKGFGELVRTVPVSAHNSPYIGYLQTSLGEAVVSYDNPVLFEVLSSGDEISEDEYFNSFSSASLSISINSSSL
jgi:hypothetical protein